MSRAFLTRYAWLSVAAALGTMALKLLAWMLTGSVGLLSDALESLVNLGGAVMALLMLRVAALPPDTGHAYGHSKAEYFSSGFEGLLIFVAGGMIVAAALSRLIHPLPQTGFGLVISGLAALVNLAVARVLLNAGRTHHSVTLEADGQHLMTDVWTSTGVITGVGMLALSGWNILDPLIALAVALHILWTGWRLANDAVRVFDRIGGRSALTATERGVKDTVLVMPGEKVRLLVTFSAHPGKFVFHCHNLEHEEDGMMLNYTSS